MSPYPVRTLFVMAGLFLHATSHADVRVFTDDFSDRRSGWFHRDNASTEDLGFAIYTDEGTYQMTPVSDATYGFVAAPRQADSEHVRISVDLFLYAGVGLGGGGVGCHYQDEKNFDLALARGDGQLVLVDVRGGDSQILAQGSLQSLFPGSVDTRLTLECEAGALRVVSTEGTRLEARTRHIETHGQAGLFVIGERSAGTSAVFDNFELEDLSTQ